MRELRNILVGIACCLGLATAFAQNEQPGSTVTYQVAETNCGATGGTIGHFYPLVICAMGFTQNGHALPTSQVYISWGGFQQTQYGWASWQMMGDLSPDYHNNQLSSAWWSVDTSTFNFNALPGFPTGQIVCNNNCSTLTADFVGVTPDDGQPYVATLTANAYFYRGCSSGRGGGCRMIMLVTDGTLRVEYSPYTH